MKDELIKKTLLTNEESTLLREKFIVEYSKKKGWNHKELTTTQMLEIATHKEYKQPGLLLG
jgi:hypothetical protein